MYETESLLAASVIVSTLTSLAGLGLLRVARLGSPRTRSIVLLVALAMSFSVFWAPFALTSYSDNTGAPEGPGLDPIFGALPVPFIDRGANVSISNGTSGPSFAFRENASFPPARLIDGRGPPGTCATQNAVPPYAIPKNFQVSVPRLQTAGGTDASVSQVAGWFWALSAVLLFAAAAYLAIQLASGKRRLLARLGARPCLDPDILGLVGRTAKKMGVRIPRVFIFDGPANAFVFGYPATLVISSRLLGRLKESELELCIRHELAHVRNGDLLVKPLLQSMRILFVYNPGVHLLVRRMLKERELAADRLFIRSRNDRIDFLSALTRLHMHAHEAHAPKHTTPSAGIPMGTSALGAHRAGAHLEERFDNLFIEQEARPLRAVSLCALIIFANLSFLGVPAAILQTSGASDAQSNTGMFPPMHGHFMSWRGAAEPGHARPANITAAEAGYPMPEGAAAAEPWHSPPGDATEDEAGHSPADNATPEEPGQFSPFRMDSPVR